MNIQLGKFYRTRCGAVCAIIAAQEPDTAFPFKGIVIIASAEVSFGKTIFPELSGTYCEGEIHKFDLIEEVIPIWVKNPELKLKVGRFYVNESQQLLLCVSIESVRLEEELPVTFIDLTSPTSKYTTHLQGSYNYDKILAALI